MLGPAAMGAMGATAAPAAAGATSVDGGAVEVSGADAVDMRRVAPNEASAPIAAAAKIHATRGRSRTTMIVGSAR